MCGTIMSTPAPVQNAEPMDSSASTDGQIDGDSELLDGDTDVIIVTATKRAQDVQQLPLAWANGSSLFRCG